MQNEITETYDLVVDCTTCRYEKSLLKDGTCSKPSCKNWALWEAKYDEEQKK